ncbi:MAG: 4a-hydroxytetrahydrobiopterin dehydratase [Croceimicrobium sp.]|nr:4a-hydroxytetrahydrobiopterin dehydratase [Bacteroidota bacterium]
MSPDKWSLKENKLVRSFEFNDFKAAFHFLEDVAKLAEEQNHHPEIYNVYNRVQLSLSTHDQKDAITDKDYNLALAINKLL